MKGFISTTFFGYFGYLLAIVTGASPWIFGFSHIGGASLFLPLLAGWFQLLMCIFSNTEAGMVGVFPIQMHCALNVFSGFYLLLSPFLYEFSPKVFWPHLILGSLILLMGVFVKKSPFRNNPHEPLQEAGMASTDAHEGRLMI